MYIKKLELINFRNYEKQTIELGKNINIFFGNNAQGKTNIIESIFLCSFGKSFRTNKDKELIKLGEKKLVIQIYYQKEDRDGKIKIEIDEKKCIYINDIKIKKLSEILGKLNIVLFSPDDINLFKEGPVNRRRLLDIMIGQLRPTYVYNLNLYLKTLEQRNNYLKQIKYENKDKKMLEIWDEKLADYAEKIYIYRKEFIEKISEKMPKIHQKITENEENIKIEFVTDCSVKKEYLNILKKEQKNDILKGYTSKGIHKDDFSIYINGKKLNIYGSQGQHRTVILSLKMCELEIIREETGENPILLLDDFMSELDSKRRNSFLKNMDDTQIIITCTEKLNIDNLKSLYFEVCKGKVINKD